MTHYNSCSVIRCGDAQRTTYNQSVEILFNRGEGVITVVSPSRTTHMALTRFLRFMVTKADEALGIRNSEYEGGL